MGGLTLKKCPISVMCVDFFFAQKYILTYNVRVHTGKRPYNCYVCGNVCTEMYINITCEGSHWGKAL